jgi:hypothetical protein
MAVFKELNEQEPARDLYPKRPATELFDLPFHEAVAAENNINNFESWSADCYNAIMQYSAAEDLDQMKDAALRIGRTAWEAAESEISIGQFLCAIADNWMDGIKDGRQAFGWMHIVWTDSVQCQYIAKTLRHFIESETAVSTENRMKHLAALFANANILWRRCDDLF